MLDGPFKLSGIEPLKLIGSGGFGEVWLARQTNIDRKVAIKVGHSPIDDETVRIRFERECIALGRLSGHPNIVDVFTAGQLDDGRPYLMMEYIDGGTLWRRLKRAPLSENELRFTGIELADALSVAHEVGVLHRDLKPENILLRQSGEAVLGDFGIARLQDGANTTSHPITASVAYAAPEILTGKDATIASDIYGLGVCLLTAATRKVPFMTDADESVHPIIERVLANDSPDLRAFGYSDGFASLVGDLLAKQGRSRPKTADEVRDRLLDLNRVDPVPDGVPAVDPATVTAPTSTGASGTATSGAVTTGRGRLGRTSIPGTRRNRTATGTVLAGDSPAAAAAAVGATPRSSGSKPSRGRSGGSLDRMILLGAMAVAAVLVVGSVAFIVFGGSDDDGDAVAAPAEVPIPLPLAEADLQLGDDVTVVDDLTGPDSSQFCDNTPTTDGLVEWTGRSESGAAGFPVVFQQIARFDTEDDAAAYVDAYLAGVDCQQWAIPGGDDGEAMIVLPMARVNGNPPGEQGIEVTFAGIDGFDLSGQVALVRRDTEVYTLSVTSFEATDVERFEPWLATAIERLEF
ncbi:MAG: serine/threonine-protein kinase [Actinomycetota bacterium]